MKYLMKIQILIFLIFLSSCSVPYISRKLHGDCVDRAVMIRQHLKRQKFEARIVMGYTKEGKGHAWVEYKDKKTGKWIEIE